MGCGKSSVGRRLSELLCCPFMDLDQVIEERTGLTIPEIFATDGETAFRAMELEALKDIVTCGGQERFPKQSLPSQAMGPSLCGQRGSTVSVSSPDHRHTGQYHDVIARSEATWQSVDMVLALGGGAVMTAECAEIVHSDTLCIYLSASVETLMEHLSGQTSNRPLMKCSGNHSVSQSRIESLLAQRSATYENTAHIIIDTDGKSIDEIARELGKHVAEQL